MATAYHVYANSGASDPIQYASPVAMTSGTSWTSATLGPGTWSFGVRAYDTSSGDEEENLDCAISVVLDALGNDVTNRPAPPSGLRALARPGGSIRVEWLYPPTRGPAAPSAFNVYLGSGNVPNESAPAANVPFAAGIRNAFAVDIPSLTGGVVYTVAVRAVNASGQDQGTATVSVIADAVGPAAVDGLMASAIV
ncbi:MAG: fibronectin type III domain-containing protein [Isosphaeraceae bacterium]